MPKPSSTGTKLDQFASYIVQTGIEVATKIVDGLIAAPISDCNALQSYGSEADIFLVIGSRAMAGSGGAGLPPTHLCQLDPSMHIDVVRQPRDVSGLR